MPRKRKNFADEFGNVLDGVVCATPPKNLSLSSIEAILQTNPLLSKLLSLLMSKERDAYLEEADDSANGFYDRLSLQTKLGKLTPSVPRSRKGLFRPRLLPSPYVRHDDSVSELLHALLLSGMSKTKVKLALAANGLAMPERLTDELCEEIETEFRQVMSRELPKEMLALVIDCKEVEGVKETGTIGKYYVYQIYGIDWNAQRDLYYFESSEEPENAKKWISIFSKLVERGLREVLLIVSDDLPGIIDAVKSIFKDSLHQLCVVHMKRNIFRHMDKDDANEFCREFDVIKTFSRHDYAKTKLMKLCERFRKKYPDLVKHMEPRAENYVQFVRFPAETRKHLYSTNVVEGLNNIVEVIRRSCGGYFRSQSHLIHTYAIFYKRLKAAKWSKPHTHVKGKLREIRTLRNSIFQVQA